MYLFKFGKREILFQLLVLLAHLPNNLVDKIRGRKYVIYSYSRRIAMPSVIFGAHHVYTHYLIKSVTLKPP